MITGEPGSGGMPADRLPTPYGGREQPRGVEVAADNGVLMAKLNKLDASLGNRLLTRIPTANGEQVFFLKTFFPTDIDKEYPESFSAVGVHPETGPILVTPGPLGWELRARIEGKPPAKSVEGNTWEELVENAEKRGAALAVDNRQRKSEVVVVDDPSTRIWTKALEKANAEATRKKEHEESMKIVLPRVISAVDELLEANVMRGKGIASTREPGLEHLTPLNTGTPPPEFKPPPTAPNTPPAQGR